MRAYTLVDIRRCSPGQQRQLLEIRNSDAVRRAMYSDHWITAEEHRRYLASLEDARDRRLFALLDHAGAVLGALGFSGIDRRHGRCDWAFYLAPAARGGVGSALECFALDWAFGPLGMEKLNCEVIETNRAVVAMHEKFGFRREGARRADVLKDGARIDVVLLGITKDEWRRERAAKLARIAEKTRDLTLAFADGADGPTCFAHHAQASSPLDDRAPSSAVS